MTNVTLSAVMDQLNPATTEASDQSYRAPKLTPKQIRVCQAFMRMKPIWREQVDQISGASNGPEIMSQLKRKGLQWTCAKQRKIDRDGNPCEPGLYTVTPEGIATLRRWGF
ncbi:MAG: hypothetical protein H7332_03265 [Bdellovibrionales bacterium]|nr:hypothetical protein [Ramlibacter sp.]